MAYHYVDWKALEFPVKLAEGYIVAPVEGLTIISDGVHDLRIRVTLWDGSIVRSRTIDKNETHYDMTDLGIQMPPQDIMIGLGVEIYHIEDDSWELVDGSRGFTIVLDGQIRYPLFYPAFTVYGITLLETGVLRIQADVDEGYEIQLIAWYDIAYKNFELLDPLVGADIDNIYNLKTTPQALQLAGWVYVVSQSFLSPTEEQPSADRPVDDVVDYYNPPVVEGAPSYVPLGMIVVGAVVGAVSLRKNI